MKRMVGAALVVTLGGCASDGAASSIAIGDFCTELYAAFCDVGQRCMTAPADRAECLAVAANNLDGCPMIQTAVAAGEITYAPRAATEFMAQIRAAQCGASPMPDPVHDVPVLTPLVEAGDVCHSDFSCKDDLVCADLTVADPQGVCAPE